MVIQLTKKCNLNCFYCKHHGMEMEELSQDIVCEIVKNAVKSGESYFDFSGGEPLLYPDFETLVKKVKQIEGVERVTVSTNGILLLDKLNGLIEAGIDGINIHMDASDAYNYTEITGAEMVLNDVLSGMWTAIARGIPVALSIVLHEKSKSSLVILAGFAKKMDIKIRFVNCGKYTEEAELLEEDVIKKLSRHVKELHKVEEHVYHSPELKGKIVFADQLTEAFA